ncbi:MAG: beta-ketoacyl synthase chain length factor [Janthinobacterium lividum]
MTTLTAYIDGIGLLGPGLADWQQAAAVLSATSAYAFATAVMPVPASLPAAERRRCGPLVKLTLAVGHAAALAAEAPVASLPLVFSASGGDGVNCHELCTMLASNDRQISPTRFHNSVHNAAPGYWSIATGAMAPSSVLCAHDGSFGAGLLESLVQLTVEQTRVLLIACDTRYPAPLGEVREVSGEFGIALVLAPQQGPHSLAQISVTLAAGAASTLEDPALEQLRMTIPAARCLPLLQSLARGETGAAVTLDYLDNTRLHVEVTACS